MKLKKNLQFFIIIQIAAFRTKNMFTEIVNIILRDPCEKTRKQGILPRGIPREEMVARKKRGKISLFWGKLCRFRLKTYIFCISTLVTNVLGVYHQYVGNHLLLYLAMHCNGTFLNFIFKEKYTYKISSKIPRSSRGIPIFSSFLVRNLHPGKP